MSPPPRAENRPRNSLTATPGLPIWVGMTAHRTTLRKRQHAAWWVVCAWTSLLVLVLVGLLAAAGV